MSLSLSDQYQIEKEVSIPSIIQSEKRTETPPKPESTINEVSVENLMTQKDNLVKDDSVSSESVIASDMSIL